MGVSSSRSVPSTVTDEGKTLSSAATTQLQNSDASQPPHHHPWMFGRVAAMLADDASTPSSSPSVVWQQHSSNFGQSLSQKQSIEVLKFPRTFHPDTATTDQTNNSEGSSRSTSVFSGGVPVMRIVGFFPGVSPRQVTQHLTNIHLRRRWDANYLAFDCIANFHYRLEPTYRIGSLFKKSSPPMEQLQQENVYFLKDLERISKTPSSATVAENSNRNKKSTTTTSPLMSVGGSGGAKEPWWCWTGACTLPQTPEGTGLIGALDTMRRSPWLQQRKSDVDRPELGSTLVLEDAFPPPILSVSLSATTGDAAASEMTTLGLRKGFSLLQHTWARHCVGSHLLDRFGFSPRSFLYEMYITRFTYPNPHKVLLPHDVEAALNETLAYSTVYQGINWDQQSNNDAGSRPIEARGDSTTARSLSEKLLSPLGGTVGVVLAEEGQNKKKKGSDNPPPRSLSLPFTTVPVAMNYQEVLILPVFDIEDDKSRYLEFARTRGGSVFSSTPVVHYPWMTKQQPQLSSEGIYHNHNDMKEIDFESVRKSADTLKGSFMIMTACNDVKPPDMVPLWVEKAVSKFFTTGAYAALHNGIVGAIREGEE